MLAISNIKPTRYDVGQVLFLILWYVALNLFAVNREGQSNVDSLLPNQYTLYIQMPQTPKNTEKCLFPIPACVIEKCETLRSVCHTY